MLFRGTPGIDTFLSTPSARRATCFRRKQSARHTNFYPRPPRGGRRKICLYGEWRIPISIHALREEGNPFQSLKVAVINYISIHALREEGDKSIPSPTG